jgi:hypothetical protein
MYFVWDKLNGEEENAARFDYEDVDDAEDAALAYAKTDHDGYNDGLYTKENRERFLKEGHPICVRDGDKGKVRTFLVSVSEFTPVFQSMEVTE